MINIDQIKVKQPRYEIKDEREVSDEINRLYCKKTIFCKTLDDIE